jgi:large repetitive protein
MRGLRRRFEFGVLWAVARTFSQSANQTSHWLWGLAARSIVAICLLAISVASSLAHTVSYGYVAGTQPGTYTFWFGTYHTAATANYMEGSIQLTCGGGFNQTVPFTTLVSVRPAGLVAGTNYFYDAGYGGEVGSPLFATTPTHTNGSLTGPVLSWQGVTFTNITYPGTCTFKYIPIAVPTAVWDPNGANGTLAGIGSGSFLLTEGLTITKTSPQTTYSAPGAVLNYSYAVKNTGNMVLTAPLTVSDNKTTVTCPPFSPLAGTSPVVNGLATGATLTCTASYTVTQADIDAGGVTNTATATSGTSTTPYTSPIASLTIKATQSPAMTVVKSTPATGFSSVGTVLTYNYVVKNTGNTTLSSPVSITDSKIPSVTCSPLPLGGLLPGGTLACSATYTVNQADLDAGFVTNTAFSKSGTTTSPTVSVKVTGTQTPAMIVTKTPSVSTYSAVGASISYVYVVKNTGNVTLTSAITITDNKIATVPCSALPVGGLAPGATLTCNATYLTTQADVDAGSVVNTASAKSGTTTSPAVSATVNAVKAPALKIVKNTTATSYSSLPTAVPYSFVVTNVGNTTMVTPVTVSDTRIAAVICPALPPAGLPPAQSITCSGSYAVTQADIDTGSVVNVATATSGTTTSPTDQHTLPAAQSRALTIVKSGSPTTFAAPNVSISYSYVVKNSGNVTIPASAAISVADNKISTVSCAAIPSGGLAPGASLTCTAAYVTTQADVDVGSITNQASATDGAISSPVVGFTVTATQTPALAVAKSSTETGYSILGQLIHFSFLVTNTGNTTATSAVTVTDSKIPSVTCPAMPPGGIAPAGTLTCTATYTITQADLDAGTVVNIAFAKSGTTTSTPPVTHTLNGTKVPALTIDKTSTSTVFATVGTVLPYAYKVTNAGNITLTAAVAVTDDKIAAVSCPAIPPGGLVPGAVLTCTGAYTVTQADIDAGSVTNTAFASSGAVISPSKSLVIGATQTSALTVLKTPGAASYATVGSTISYSYKVTNTGNVTLKSAVTIADNKIPAVSCPVVPATGLAPGAFHYVLGHLHRHSGRH